MLHAGGTSWKYSETHRGDSLTACRRGEMTSDVQPRMTCVTQHIKHGLVTWIRGWIHPLATVRRKQGLNGIILLMWKIKTYITQSDCLPKPSPVVATSAKHLLCLVVSLLCGCGGSLYSWVMHLHLHFKSQNDSWTSSFRILGIESRCPGYSKVPVCWSSPLPSHHSPCLTAAKMFLSCCDSQIYPDPCHYRRLPCISHWCHFLPSVLLIVRRSTFGLTVASVGMQLFKSSPWLFCDYRH